MCAFRILLAVDSSLGRVDYSSLSDQTLMEILIDGFDDETTKRYRDEDGMFIDVCDWECITCDADKRVVGINLEDDAIGSFQLSHIPPKVRILHLANCRITGEIDFKQISEALREFNLNDNQLTGSADVAHLPETMNSSVATTINSREHWI